MTLLEFPILFTDLIYQELYINFSKNKNLLIDKDINNRRKELFNN